MSNFTIRQISLALLLSAFVAAPAINLAQAAGSDTPAPPPASDTKSQPKDKKKDEKKSSIEDPAFLQGYRTAYATIYEQNDYAAAIPQLKALGQDDRADVANLIGYSYRKLGNYELASVWYERALKADPGHVRTWQYYGLWQVEQGNREQAKHHLARIEALAGRDSAEYQSLASALTSGRTSY
ncbi:MAG TPA: tetratricopeptide repeat protein [Afipia sp.]